jgi:hypothetical protein
VNVWENGAMKNVRPGEIRRCRFVKASALAKAEAFFVQKRRFSVFPSLELRKESDVAY